MRGVTALSQGAWYRPDKTGTDLGGSINVLTSLHPTPYAKGNPQHTNLVEVEGLIKRVKKVLKWRAGVARKGKF